MTQGHYPLIIKEYINFANVPTLDRCSWKSNSLLTKLDSVTHIMESLYF